MTFFHRTGGDLNLIFFEVRGVAIPQSPSMLVVKFLQIIIRLEVLRSHFVFMKIVSEVSYTCTAAVSDPTFLFINLGSILIILLENNIHYCHYQTFTKQYCGLICIFETRASTTEWFTLYVRKPVFAHASIIFTKVNRCPAMHTCAKNAKAWKLNAALS